jgi:hypothetical protein
MVEDRAWLGKLQDELRGLLAPVFVQAAGEDVDPREHVSGVVYEPGSRRRAANGRLVMRAIRHGVDPGPWIDELEMPTNIAVFRSTAGPGDPPQGRLGALFRRWRARAL